MPPTDFQIVREWIERKYVDTNHFRGVKLVAQNKFHTFLLYVA